MDMEVIAAGDVMTTALPQMESFEDWDEFGTALSERLEETKRAYGGLMFALGDWFVHGQSKWGDDAFAANAATNYSVKTLRNAAWVARAIPIDQRRASLDFGHHDVVAALEYLEREQWLTKAEQDELSVHQLRKEVREAKMAENNKLADDRDGRPELPAELKPVEPDEVQATGDSPIDGLAPLVIEQMGKSFLIKEQVSAGKEQALATFYDQGKRMHDDKPLALAIAEAVVEYLAPENEAWS